MKIRKFNEGFMDIASSLPNKGDGGNGGNIGVLDQDYIKYCFVDFIDSGAEIKENFFGRSYEREMYITLRIVLPHRVHLIKQGSERESISGENKLTTYIDEFNEMNSVFQEIGNSIRKLSDEYPNYLVSSDIDPYSTPSTIAINIYFG